LFGLPANASLIVRFQVARAEVARRRRLNGDENDEAVYREVEVDFWATFLSDSWRASEFVGVLTDHHATVLTERPAPAPSPIEMRLYQSLDLALASREPWLVGETSMTAVIKDPSAAVGWLSGKSTRQDLIPGSLRRYLKAQHSLSIESHEQAAAETPHGYGTPTQWTAAIDQFLAKGGPQSVNAAVVHVKIKYPKADRNQIRKIFADRTGHRGRGRPPKK
jgi:hypothetical protein